jgi:hypothetical protein
VRYTEVSCIRCSQVVESQLHLGEDGLSLANKLCIMLSTTVYERVHRWC